MERYYIGTWASRRWYIHRFVGSDPKRGWHDHPWSPAYSAVLWGEYGEERITPTDTQYRNRLHNTRAGLTSNLTMTTSRVRWFNILHERTAHRVVIGNDWTPTNMEDHGTAIHNHTSRSPECWTLFAHPVSYTQPWGFWRDVTPKSPDLYAIADQYQWQPHDGVDGNRTSGVWWDTAPLGRLHPHRVPARW